MVFSLSALYRFSLNIARLPKTSKVMQEEFGGSSSNAPQKYANNLPNAVPFSMS